MEPKCCKNCKYRAEDGGCLASGKNCEQWRSWFYREWAAIRKAAAQIKEARDERRARSGEN